MDLIGRPVDDKECMTSAFILNFGDKEAEAIYYKRLWDEIRDILEKNGYTVEVKEAGDRWKYGIPGYANHNQIFVKW